MVFITLKSNLEIFINFGLMSYCLQITRLSSNKKDKEKKDPLNTRAEPTTEEINQNESVEPTQELTNDIFLSAEVRFFHS